MEDKVTIIVHVSAQEGVLISEKAQKVIGVFNRQHKAVVLMHGFYKKSVTLPPNFKDYKVIDNKVGGVALKCWDKSEFKYIGEIAHPKKIKNG